MKTTKAIDKPGVDATSLKELFTRLRDHEDQLSEDAFIESRII